jgi:cytochrome P450
MIDQAPDFFTDAAVVDDPFSYYDHARSHGPVWQEPYHGCFVVTGYPEAVEVYRDTDTYSSANAFGGPFPPLPDGPHGDDVTEAIERNRHVFVSSESLIAFDPPKHHDHRTLMMRLLTPKRLQENEAYMWHLADEQIDTFASSGRCEFLADYAQPVAMLVIADLLGVPIEDRPELRRRVVAKGVAGAPGATMEGNFLAHLEDVFTEYILERRREPRDDVMTKMAQGTFPDGSAPDLMEVVRVATFLFAGGQGTAARFLGNAMRFLAEHPDVQDRLRRDPDHIPAFVEETLRYASPVKTNFRMARRTTSLGGVDVPAGSTMMILMPAADRDERRFGAADEFDLDRPNAREHIAFGRGIHSCPGAPLVRFEGRITVQRMLERLRDIRLSEEHHGPPGDRRFEISPTYILAGVDALHLEFKAA